MPSSEGSAPAPSTSEDIGTLGHHSPVSACHCLGNEEQFFPGPLGQLRGTLLHCRFCELNGEVHLLPNEEAYKGREP